MAQTITETKVEAVEREVPLCTNCGQKTEGDEEIVVGVDLREVDYRNGKRKKPVAEETICKYCAESLFNYTPPRTRVGQKATPMYRNLPEGVFAKIGFAVTMVLVGIFSLSLFLMVPA